MEPIVIRYHSNSLGDLLLGSYQGSLCLLDYRYRKTRKTVDARLCKGLGTYFVEGDNELLSYTLHCLEEYLLGERRHFELPLLLHGTPFQKTIWSILASLPYGSTISYLEVSQLAGKEKAVRAVANAVGANPLGIVIPCHRVIAHNGALGGYAGGLVAKKKLLDLEKDIHA